MNRYDLLFLNRQYSTNIQYSIENIQSSQPVLHPQSFAFRIIKRQRRHRSIQMPTFAFVFKDL